MKTVIEMGRQAWEETGEGWTVSAWFVEREKSFKRFADLVRADAIAEEREACAKVAETYREWDDTGMGIAAAIRNRSQK